MIHVSMNYCSCDHLSSLVLFSISFNCVLIHLGCNLPLSSPKARHEMRGVCSRNITSSLKISYNHIPLKVKYTIGFLHIHKLNVYFIMFETHIINF